MRSLIALTVGLLFSTSAPAAVLEVKKVTASSYYTEDGSYQPDNVADGKQGTAWVEGDPGAGLGAWIELDLGERRRVDSVRIWGGDWYNETSWKRANRPKELEIKLEDGTTEVVTLKDAKEAQVFSIGGKQTQTVRLRIKSTYSGSTWPDTGISEVQVIGDGALPGHVASLSASSHAPADGDGHYKPSQAADQLTDTMWCEGDEGDGTGQSLTFDFGEPVSISKLTWINGIGTSLPLWMQANRASKITLAFDEGAHSTSVKPSYRPAAIDFPKVTTSKVTLTFDAVLKGPKYNDLCVSEAWFSE